MKRRSLVCVLLLAVIMMAGCAGGVFGGTPTASPFPTLTSTATHPATLTPRPTDPNATPVPMDYDPLTGLYVDDPDQLDRRPLVIKVSNESPEVRPQSGLSFADHVWEYQMEGFQQTRFTAIYYGQSPEWVGSVRSARLIDAELMNMYQGLLVYSGCSTGMCYILSIEPWWDRLFREDGVGLVRMDDIPRPGTNRYHRLFALPEQVWELAEERGVNQRPFLEPMIFNTQPPGEGIPTTDFIIDYPDLGPRHRWHYDEETGHWLSFTEDQRFRAEEAPDIDLLSGEQLAFDNVILLYVDHFLADFIEDEPNQLASVGVNMLGLGDAVLMRDGMRYEVQWRRGTHGDLIQIVDEEGRIIPLRPGTTWFSVYSANMYSPEVFFLEPGATGE